MPSTRSLLACLSLVAAVAACGSSPAGATPAGVSTPGQPAATQAVPAATQAAPATQASEAEPTPGTALTACELVSPADIEAALGLEDGSVPPGEHKEDPTVLDPASNECRYDDDSWGGLIVAVTPTDGVNTYDAVESAFGEDAEAVDVGDGGLWFEKNDRGYFLKGSVMVRLQFTYVVEGGLTSFRDPTIALGEAAVAKI